MEAQGNGTISLWTFIASLDRSDITNPFYSMPRKLLATGMRSNVSPSDLSAFLSAGDRSSEERPETDDSSPTGSTPGSHHTSGVLSPPIRIALPPSLNESSRDNASTWALPSPSTAPQSQPIRRVSWSIPDREGDDEELTRSRAGSIAEEEEDDGTSDVLIPCALSRALKFWSRYYLRWDPSTVPQRASSSRIEVSHRELQFQLMDAHQQLEYLRGVVSELERAREDDQRLAREAQATAEAAIFQASQSPTLPPVSPAHNMIDLTSPATENAAVQLEILTQRKLEAMAQLEREFAEEAAKILQPVLDDAPSVATSSSSVVAVS